MPAALFALFAHSASGGRLLDLVFSSVELVATKEGNSLREVQRVVGTNDVGMLAWRVTMKTPEYPDGREVVVIANDITHMSGSFGLPEDEFFQSTYCFVPRGNTPWTRRLFDAILSDCIPVVLSNPIVFPFEEFRAFVGPGF